MPRDDLRRLTSPQGSIVQVSAEYAEELIPNGYVPIEEKPKRKSEDTTKQGK